MNNNKRAISIEIVKKHNIKIDDICYLGVEKMGKFSPYRLLTLKKKNRNQFISSFVTASKFLNTNIEATIISSILSFDDFYELIWQYSTYPHKKWTNDSHKQQTLIAQSNENSNEESWHKYLRIIGKELRKIRIILEDTKNE